MREAIGAVSSHILASYRCVLGKSRAREASTLMIKRDFDKDDYRRASRHKDAPDYATVPMLSFGADLPAGISSMSAFRHEREHSRFLSMPP